MLLHKDTMVYFVKTLSREKDYNYWTLKITFLCCSTSTCTMVRFKRNFSGDFNIPLMILPCNCPKYTMLPFDRNLFAEKIKLFLVITFKEWSSRITQQCLYLFGEFTILPDIFKPPPNKGNYWFSPVDLDQSLVFS